MTASASSSRTPPHAVAHSARAFAPVLALFALGLALSGCAGLSDNEGLTAAFADPAKYELWDCKQLEPERKSLANREADLLGLMAKAETGTAGTLVAETTYRGEYMTVRGQAHFAEEAWRKNKCHATPPGAATAATASQPTEPTAKHSRSHNSAVY
jgi:hypothetical protein